MYKDTDKTKEQLIAELTELRKKSKEQTDELKANNQQLEASNKELIGKEHLLSSIFNTVGDVLFLIDAEAESKFRFKYINKAFIDATGLSRSDIEGKLIEEVIPEPSISLVKENYLKSIKEKKLIKWEENTEYPAGVKIGIVSIVPVIDEKGNCRQLVGSVHDITDRKRAEKALKESEEKFQKIIYESFDGISVTDEEGKIIIWNDALERITGIKKAQTIDRYIWDVQTELLDHETAGSKRKEEVKKTLLDILKTGEAPWLNKVMERKYVHPDGTIKMVSGRMYIIKTQKGYLVVSVSNDNTEHKQAEEDLVRYQTLLKSSLESFKDVIVLSIDKNYNYLYFNKAHFEGMQHTYNKDVEIGMNLLDCMTSEEDIQKAKVNYDRALAGESHSTIQVYGDAERYYYETFYNPIRNEKNEIIGATAMARNITERKQAEEKLKESEEKFRALYDNAPLSYQSLNEDGSFKDVNPTWLSTLGYEREDIIGKFYKDFLHPDWQAHFEKNFPAFKKRGYVNDVQFKIRHKKGHYLDISFEGCIGYNPDGSFKQTYCVFQDITERKQAEKELSKLYTAVMQSPSIIAITDTDGKLEYVNPKFSEITGYNHEEVIGQNPHILQSGEHSPEMYKKLWKTILSGKIWQGEFHNKKKNGELYWESASISPILDEKGKIINYLKDSEDITESKKAEKELRKYRDHLEELVKDRTSKLEKTLKEVERMNELFVGREFRIKELRDEVKDLKQKLNNQ